MVALRLPDPQLCDDAVRLRAWCDADVPAARRATDDPLVLRFTRVAPGQTDEDLRRFISGHEPARIAGEALELAIADTACDAFLGAVSVMHFEWAHSRAEIGYYVVPDARGRGVATRAVGLLARWALRELGLARLALFTDPDNIASQRVAERCGFAREGLLRSFEERNGRRDDLVVFSLLPADLA
jgi:RimJ/RimL family protein N-acetyltransferase